MLFCYIFEIGFKKYGVMVEKSLFQRRLKKNSQTHCCLYTNLATVKFEDRQNNFPLTCSFQKGPQKLFGRSHLMIVKISTIHFT